MLKEVLGSNMDFLGEEIRTPALSKEQGLEIAGRAGVKLTENFDGTIGSIFLPLTEMKTRVDSCEDYEKAILRSISRLHASGIYEEREKISLDKLKYVCERKEGLIRDHYQWVGLLERLATKGLLSFDGKTSVSIEEAYLNLFEEDGTNDFDNIKIMAEVFIDDAESLIMIGNHTLAIIRGDFKKLELLELAIGSFKRAEEIHGSDHPSTALSLNNLAGLYHNMGRYKEAGPLYQRSLTIKEKVLGSDHPSTALSLNNLARLYHNMGRHGEAEPLYQRSLTIKEKVLGTDHPDTAATREALSALLETWGK